jgi:hypothetical protein
MAMLPVAGVNNSVYGSTWFEERRSSRANRPVDPSSDPPNTCENVIARLAETYHEFKSDYELWHPRLAHINPRTALIAKPDLKDWPKKQNCDDCTLGKFHKHPHSGKRPAAADLPWAPGEYFTCDLFGPLLRSRGGGEIFCILQLFEEHICLSQASQT